jgi:hypothetical protein
MNTPTELESLEIAREYAWSWFALHASQRMQHLNHFLIAAAFLFAAYGTALPHNEVAAIGVALVGFLTCLAFHRLELRTRELVKLGEDALRCVEDVLAGRVGIPELRLTARAEKPERKFMGTYRQAIQTLEWSIAIGFIGAAILATVRLYEH